MAAEHGGWPADRGGERGVALLVTLLTVALLTVTVMQFTYASQVDYRRTSHWLKARQAALLAESGLELAREMLMYADLVYFLQHLEQKQADSLNEMWSLVCSQPGPSACPSAGKAGCMWSFGEDPGDGEIAVRVEDATARFNLNWLRDVNSNMVPPQPVVGVFNRLLLLTDIDPALAGPIVDWVDAGARPYGYGPGAEASAYIEDDLTYQPRDRPFQTFRELALVKGIGASEVAKLDTVATAHDLRDQDGEPVQSININTAPLEVIRALHERLDVNVGLIHEQRCLQPFTEVDQIEELVGELPAWLESWIHFRSDLFRIRATGRVDDVFQSVEALVELDRAGRRSTVTYFLPRRGPNIAGVDMSQTGSLDQLGAAGPAGGGRF